MNQKIKLPFVVLGIAIFLSVLFAFNKASSDEIKKYNDSINNFKEGNLSKAEELLRKEINQSIDDKLRFEAMDLLLYQCLSGNNVPCITEILSQAELLFDKVLDDKHAQIFKAWYSSIHMSLLPKSELSKLYISKDFLTDIGWMSHIDSHLYSRIQLRYSSILRKIGRIDEASEAVKRGIFGLFKIQPSNDYLIALTIMDIIDSLTEEGNTNVALKWLVITEPFLMSVLAKNGPDYARFLVQRSTISASVLQPHVLAPLYKEAYDSIKRIDYKKNVKDFMLGQIINEYALILSLSNHGSEALQLFETHPFASIENEIINGSINLDPSVINYVISKIVINSNLNKNVDTEWQDVIDRARNKNIFNNDFIFKRYPRDIRDDIDFASGVLVQKNNLNEGEKFFISSAKSRLKSYQLFRVGYSNSFPLINFWDRIIVELGVLSGIDIRDPDLVISGSEILDRNTLSYLIGAKSVIATQENSLKQQIARKWVRDVQQRNDWEIQQLKKLINKSANQIPFDSKDVSLSSTIYVDSAWRERADKALISSLTAKLIYPTLNRLQQSLHEGEAFIKFTFAAGKLVRYCVTNQNYIIPSAKQIDLSRFVVSQKNIENSLHYSGPVNAEGASNYPIEDAKYLWSELTEGLDTCIASSKHLIINLPFYIRGVPIEALVDSSTVKPEVGNNFELQNWVGLKWGVSYADSAQAFIVARESSPNVGGDLPYLGIGNPKFDHNVNIEKDKKTILAYTRGEISPVSIKIDELGELPSTKDEIKSFEQIFSNKSSILLGEQSTELNFRSKSLSRYDIIHFATHALISEEIPGIKEASLVLTPGLIQDPLKDGLLTATEISGLDLNARIVMLSACNSAKLDPQFFGSQLSGLSAAFSLAGVPTLFASLWELDDKATLHLMEFHAQEILAHGEKSIAEIHKDALKKFISDKRYQLYRHPRYWASLVILGDGSLAFRNPNKNTEVKHEIILGKDNGELPFIIADKNHFFSVELVESFERVGKYASILRKTTIEGKIEWSVEEKSAGIGPIMQLDNDIIGFYPLELESGDISLIMRVIDSTNGNIKKNLEISLFNSIPFAIFQKNNETIVLSENTQKSKRTYSIVSPDGFTKSIKDISLMEPIGLSGSLAFARQLRNSDIIIVESDANNNEYNGKLDLNKLDEFGFPAGCPWKHKSIISHYDNNGNKKGKDIIINGYLVRNITELETRNLLISATRIDNCKLEGNGTVLMMDELGNYKEIWSDIYFPSDAFGAIYNDSELIIIENMKETISLYNSENEFKESHDTTFSKFFRFGSSVQKDMLSIVRLNLKTKKENRTVYSSGLRDLTDGFVKVDEKILVYGNRAGRPRVMVLH